MRRGGGWPEYVPVGKRRTKAAREVDVMRSAGIAVQPVILEGRKIATTFWALKWCEHLESFSDYENRLPRGRTYVRNGSVLHMTIGRGEVKAMVSGTSIYHVRILIKELPPPKWATVKERCAGKIGSLLELLQGKFSTEVMSVVTHKHEGLFPLPAEITLECSCPDWAKMCKHVAAVMYGIGSRLDLQPELLFLLRAVPHQELLQSSTTALTSSENKSGSRRRLATTQLSNVFGIDIVAEEPAKTAITKTIPEKSQQASTKPTSEILKKEKPPTAHYVRTLRRKLGLKPIEFADYLGITEVTLRKWESSRGPLNLRQSSLEALRRAEKET